jgi:hypothetical protein
MNDAPVPKLMRKVRPQTGGTSRAKRSNVPNAVAPFPLARTRRHTENVVKTIEPNAKKLSI